MGILSVLFYVGLKLVSNDIYQDAIWALGLMIAFYYGLTGYAAAIYYRHQLLRSVKNLVLIGVLPVVGGLVLTWAFIASALDMADPEMTYSGVTWFGVTAPLAITIVSLLLGLVLMILWWWRAPAFFRRRPETFVEAAPGDHLPLPPAGLPKGPGEAPIATPQP
jgi:hypothetical protein